MPTVTINPQTLATPEVRLEPPGVSTMSECGAGKCLLTKRPEAPQALAWTAKNLLGDTAIQRWTWVEGSLGRRDERVAAMAVDGAR
ncbi:MAG: hypothetical protein LBK72_08535 [Bifidobacteriaceae bacterium]|jgi:hypothetical protein|nr:hypothetical protein [Bifidobacteriaceae bacterium]